MPTYYQTSNACKQYNEVNDMINYIVNDTSVTGIKFLSESPETRILNTNELSALYFLSNDTSFTGFAQYTYYDIDGNTPMQTNVALYPNLVKYHNAIPVNWIGADPTAVKMRVRLIRATSVAITEDKFFILDNSQECTQKQITWLNKLGGYDTFMFAGGQEYIIDAQKENPIEYPFNTNFESPLRINAYRSINSKKSFTLANRCKTKETADWLKSELVNSSDVYVIENDVYIPVDVKTATVEYNSWSKEFIVKFAFSYSFPINIQTR
jgi:hypothetical protein